MGTADGVELPTLWRVAGSRWGGSADTTRPARAWGESEQQFKARGSWHLLLSPSPTGRLAWGSFWGGYLPFPRDPK